MGWCRVWSVEVNGEKCGAMHIKRKGVKRTEEKFYGCEEHIAIPSRRIAFPCCTAMPVHRNAKRKCCCSNGNNGGHHLHL